MIKIEARNLEQAFEKASQELNCSVADLTYEVVQNPKKGLFGIGKKNAIIVASCEKKSDEPQKDQKQTKKGSRQKPRREESRKNPDQTKSQPKPPTPPVPETPKQKEPDAAAGDAVEKNDVDTSKSLSQIDAKSPVKGEGQNSQIIDNFFQEKEQIDDIAKEVERELKEMFSHACFELDSIDVSVYDENTLYIEFAGNDAALLIGKEGYRYKALSYMLFNWVNARYNLMIRLEIAEFLKNQEEMIASYLEPIIRNIENDGRGQTKPLDGVLAHIALKQLRERFQDKYVSFRTTSDGDRFVIVNEFKH